MRLAIQWQVVLMVTSLWFVTDGALGEEDRRGKQSAETKPRPLSLRLSEIYLGFESEYDLRRVRSSVPGRKDSVHENRDLRFDELLGLALDGFVVDPNLIDWRAQLELGITQNRFTEKIDHFSQSDWDTGGLHEYDLSIDAFKTKPISLNAYARRSDDRIARRFLPTLREQQTETGVSLLAIKGPFTTEVGFSWRDVDRSGNRLNEDDEHFRTSRFYIDHKWDISDTHKLRLRYDHQREESSYQGSSFDFDTRRDEVRLEHEFAFGPQSKHRLDTYLRYNEEQGDLARDEFELVPRLTLHHSDKFQTVYRYGFYRFEQDAIEVNQHKFDVQALYQPDDHWRYTLDGFALYERVDQDIQTQEFGGQADISYNRPTPLGELSMNLAFAYDEARTTGDAGQRIVRGEAHVLGNVRPVFLKETGVIRSSILAHNGQRTRIFVEGVDYLVSVTRGRALVTRVPSGRIVDNDVVYFDYAYLIPADATVDTYRTDFMIEHAFDFGLTPYYYFESRCEDVEASRGTPWGRDNTHRHRLGLRYSKKNWTVGGELEIFDDSVEPYDAVHLTGQWGLLRSRGHSLNLSGELSRYCFEGGLDERRVWWLDLDLKDRMQINRYLSIDTGLAYRREDDSRDGKTNGVDAECGLSYTRGYLTVDLSLEYDLLSIADNRENGLAVYLNVRRNLSHLLTPSRSTQ